MSFDGNTVAVGAPREDSSGAGVGPLIPDNSSANSGAVYVYFYNGIAWTVQTTIKSPFNIPNLQFGISLAISDDGNTLAVGAPFQIFGSVHIYTRAGSIWSHQQELTPVMGTLDDICGSSLALSGDGNTVTIGCYLEDGGQGGINGDQNDNTVSGSGCVRVWKRVATNWTEEAYIKNLFPSVNLQFGKVISLSGDGNHMIVGTAAEDSDATGVNGGKYFCFFCRICLSWFRYR